MPHPWGRGEHLQGLFSGSSPSPAVPHEWTFLARAGAGMGHWLMPWGGLLRQTKAVGHQQCLSWEPGSSRLSQTLVGLGTGFLLGVRAWAMSLL